MAFDLVSHAYGWTDDVIMDLPIRTLRQKIAAINRRMYFERRERIELLSWQTRIGASFTAGGYWTDGKNPALDQAMGIAYDAIETARLKEAAELADIVDADFDPENPPMPEVARGTFERFMGSMGDNSRWAGR